jgi:hypothetical protein
VGFDWLGASFNRASSQWLATSSRWETLVELKSLFRSKLRPRASSRNSMCICKQGGGWERAGKCQCNAKDPPNLGAIAAARNASLSFMDSG